MNILTFILQTQPAPQGGGWSIWLMIILMFVIMYFFMIRPQKKQEKELADMRNSLEVGDEVVTIGGIYGTVDEIKDRTVLIKVDGDTKLKVDRNSLVKDFSETQQQ